MKDPKKLALAFSNQPIQVLPIEESLYIYFPKPEQGHIYFRVNPDYKSCLQIAVKKVGDKISTELESDLIKKGEKAIYPFLSTPNGLFRFDIELTWILP